MNCHDFEAIAGDLARDQLMDAAQRERALAHSSSCARCAASLGDQRALTDGLGFLARNAHEQAPTQVEAALLAVYRELRTAAPAIAPARTATQRWVYVAASIAAIALIATLLALTAFRARDSQQPAPQNATYPSSSVPDDPRPTSPQQQTAPAIEKRDVAIKDTGRRGKTADRDRNAGHRKAPAEDLNKPAAAAEIATDFIPLMNRETLAQMDGGQVMRVELPRSALMSFGLPMDMERASERIKADVVVGNDGMARAIRFVR